MRNLTSVQRLELETRLRAIEVASHAAAAASTALNSAVLQHLAPHAGTATIIRNSAELLEHVVQEAIPRLRRALETG